MTQFSAGESWDQMRCPENYCAIVGMGKGVESLETERKEPGGHSPCTVAPQGARGVIGCRCQGHRSPCFGVSSTCTISVFIVLSAGFPSPLFVLAVSSVSSSWALSHTHFLLCFSALTLISASPILTSPFPAFWSHSQWGGKAAQETPHPPALQEKIGPRRQTLSLVCWKQVG